MGKNPCKIATPRNRVNVRSVIIGVYILYCIVLRVGMWRLYRCVIYSNSFWARPFFFGSRSADRSPVVNIEASSAVVALS